MPSSERDRRRANREAVCRAAEITHGDAVVDCLVLDVSILGVRVRVAAETPIPEQVALRFRNGSTFPVLRRWVRGRQVGFEFAGTPVLTGEASQHASASFEALRERGPRDAVRLLRAVRFFDDVTLSRIAEEAEAAHLRLEAALRERMRATDAAEVAAPAG